MTFRSALVLLAAIAAAIGLRPDSSGRRTAPDASLRPEPEPPLPRFHIAASRSERARGGGSWTGTELLTVLDSLCSALARRQDQRGAVVDPYREREFQYATPYFAYAVGVLLEHGRAGDLAQAGVRAMAHATASFAGGHERIPDGHGEFFLAPLARALELYAPHVEDQRLRTWRARLSLPLAEVIKSPAERTNNWRTYAMRGEWLRARAGLVDSAAARRFVERGWHERSQRARIVPDRWNLYQDWSSDPQSHAVEAVGRTNLLALVHEGYDGPSSGEIARAAERGTRTALLLQAPDGQAPPNGRTDDHVWNDVVYALAFEIAAGRAWRRGDTLRAGRFRRAVDLGLSSVLRWRRSDGSFFVTKNRYPPERRVGYQPASSWSNYNAAIAYHLAELVEVRVPEIAPRPAPSEIGGYALSTDPAFGSFVADAGGMQVVVNRRGAYTRKYGDYWTPLGTVRFARSGWDGRLGPGDGIHAADGGARRLLGLLGRWIGKPRYDYRIGSSVTFGPTWREAGRWVRIGDLAEAYRATVERGFVHPLLVRFTLTYHDVTGRGGPIVRQRFTVTPDGVLVRTSGPEDRTFGTLVALLAHDGAPLQIAVGDAIARTRYPSGTGPAGNARGDAAAAGPVSGRSADEQTFLALSGSGDWTAAGRELLSSYGRLLPVRIRARTDTQAVFVYPRSSDDPSPEAVRASFSVERGGFHSVLARVSDSTYVGRRTAGGYGRSLDLEGDGREELTFDRPCRFVVQLEADRPTRIEADRSVTLRYRGRTSRLEPFRPLALP